MTRLSPPNRKSRLTWLTTFSVAASAAATDWLYWMERCVNWVLLADHDIAAASMARAMAPMTIVSIRALPVWSGFCVVKVVFMFIARHVVSRRFPVCNNPLPGGSALVDRIQG